MLPTLDLDYKLYTNSYYYFQGVSYNTVATLLYLCSSTPLKTYTN